MMYLRTTHQQTVNSHDSTIHALELIDWDSNTINDENTFEAFSFFQLSTIALKKSCISWTVLDVFVTSFKHQNDVTPSNAKIHIIFSCI